MIATSCGENREVNLGCKYRLINSASFSDLTIVKEHNTVVVDGHILDYTFDSIFIVVAQRPRDSIPNIKAMNYSEATEAFEKSTFRQYWIINKKEKSEYSLDTLSNLARYSNVYGPFKKGDYLRKREELNVPQKLVLKEE
jgi:hypothetical protein